MRIQVLFLGAVFSIVSGCSGFLPSSLSRGGQVVSPDYLAQFEGGGSLSTVWYLGSDDEYHYFVHYVKIATKYRINKKNLPWSNEHPLGQEYKPQLVEHEFSTFVRSRS